MTDKELLHLWNREAANAGFAGSEYFNDPVNVFFSVRSMRDNWRESVKLRHEVREQRDALLAACKAFVSAWENCLQLEKTDVALSMAREAIAKAEGKS